MAEWLVYLICGLICVTVIIVLDIIKCAIKNIAKKKGKELNMKKAEYPLASLSISLPFVFVLIFLYFGKYLKLNMTDILKISGIFATSSQTIYLFIVQLPKKGALGIYHKLQTLFNITKKDTKPTDKVKEIIEEIKDFEIIEDTEKTAEKKLLDILK